MRTMSRLYRPLRALSFAFAIIALGACAASRAPGAEAQTANDEASARSAPAAMPAPAATQPTQESPAPKKPVRTGGPLPPEPVPGRVVVDHSCKTDADCAVKNVGNCCGYYPACVNVNSPTDPKGVQAECAKQGMASVCGFPEISSCNCTQGRCEAAPGGAQVR